MPVGCAVSVVVEYQQDTPCLVATETETLSVADLTVLNGSVRWHSGTEMTADTQMSHTRGLKPFGSPQTAHWESIACVNLFTQVRERAAAMVRSTGNCAAKLSCHASAGYVQRRKLGLLADCGRTGTLHCHELSLPK